jgi:HEAT repeat protein
MATDISSLLEDLRCQEAPKRRAAAERLAGRADEARSAAVELVRLCNDTDIGPWIVATLEELGPPDASAVAPLSQIVLSEVSDQAYWAATLLGRLKHQAAAAVSSLTAALADSPHVPVRQRSAWALGEIGSAAREAEAVLRRAASDADPRTARLANEALARVMP